MSELTWEELHGRADADYRAARGRVIGVTYAQLGDGSDLWDADYPRSRPLRVRITNNPFGECCGNEHEREGGLLDTYWEAEAMPGQLPEGVHVSWVDGPTYYLDGRAETPEWVMSYLPGTEACPGGEVEDAPRYTPG